MSGGGGGPIIIGTLTFSDPSRLPPETVAELRGLAAKARMGVQLTMRERLYVAYASFVYLGYL